MTSGNIPPHVIAARDALATFLSMLLGEEVPLQVEPPEQTTVEQAAAEAASHVVLVGTYGSGDAFVVLLEPGWVSLCSEAMLGEALEVGDEGVDDLLRELAGQGYGSIRNQLATAGLKLPEASFDVLEHGTAVPDGALPADVWELIFRSQAGDRTVSGKLLLSASVPLVVEEEPVQEEQPALSASGGGASAPATPKPAVSVSPASFPELGNEAIGGDGADNFQLLAEVELEVTVELGRRKLPLADVLRLTTGSVIELEKLVGEPLEVYANGRLIAEGEAVVIDEQFGIRITRLASARQRTKAFL